MSVKLSLSLLYASADKGRVQELIFLKLNDLNFLYEEGSDIKMNKQFSFVKCRKHC
jgi:hypothetical protein